MASASESVRHDRPEWFFSVESTKEATDYHEGWLDPEDLWLGFSLHYARVDAFSQAMIARWLISKGLGSKITAPSNGLKMALQIRYFDQTDMSQVGYVQEHQAAEKFRQMYPPLNREMQDVAERSIIGGEVWGETGTWKGTFCHLDYSSSYPYEYAYGKMFRGRVQRVLPDSPLWERTLKADVFRWVLVSFSFNIKDTGMAAISGRECVTPWEPMTGRLNKKIREGRVVKRLYTESYWQELQRHYDMSEVTIHEIWWAKRFEGDFAPFIKMCYETKNHLKKIGLGKSADYDQWKKAMNAGIHGKTITKTHRRSRTFFDGEMQLNSEVTEPEYCFMLGFTGMLNARERLLRHCRMVREAGHHVLMCDTDSMVVDCPVSELKRILGDWFTSEESEDMEHNLGRFEVETFEGRAEFDEFRCWGLKRYMELDHGRIRKTAFAGMHEELQPQIIDWETDGTKYQWEQIGKKTLYYGVNLLYVRKTAGAEDVWDSPLEVPDPERDVDMTTTKQVWKAIKEGRI